MLLCICLPVITLSILSLNKQYFVFLLSNKTTLLINWEFCWEVQSSVWSQLKWPFFMSTVSSDHLKQKLIGSCHKQCWWTGNLYFCQPSPRWQLRKYHCNSSPSPKQAKLMAIHFQNTIMCFHSALTPQLQPGKKEKIFLLKKVFVNQCNSWLDFSNNTDNQISSKFSWIFSYKFCTFSQDLQ